MIKNIKNKIKTFLLWTQKWTKTDMIYLVKGGSWLSTSKYICAVFGILMSVALANFLPESTFGTYKYVLSLAGLLSIFSLGGLNSMLIKAVAQGFEKNFIQSIKVKTKWGLLGSLVGILISLYYLYNGDISLFFSLIIVSLALPFSNSFKLYQDFLNGKKDFKKWSIYKTIIQIIFSLFIILTVFLTKNIIVILLVFYLLDISLHLFFTIKTNKEFKLNAKSDPESIKQGKHLSLMNAFGKATNYIDNILIFLYLGPLEVAVYSLALKPKQEISGTFSNLETLSFPKLSERSIPEIKKSLPPKMIKLFLLAIPLVALYIIAAPYIFSLLYPKYMASVIYSQVYATTILLSPFSLMHKTLIIHFQKKQLYFLQTFLPILKILLFIILLPLYKVWGMIATLMIIQFINLMLVTYFFKKLK